MRPRLLDLFCGAGGAAVGYHRAGFDVTGVDIRPQPCPSPTRGSSCTSRSCPFCELVADPPSWALLHGAGLVVSFKPRGPATPLHRLFVPVQHVSSAAEDPALTGRVFEEAAEWAAQKGVPFNLVVNSGQPAGQSVAHLHVHYVPRSVGDGLGYRFRRKRQTVTA